MKIKFIIITSILFIGTSFISIEKTGSPVIKIEWVKNLEGDFSFKEKWSYPEFIYKNSFGQLSCDGSCPNEINHMKDARGKIYKDSLKSFYKIIDTTHIFHSLKSKNRMYEYSGTQFIEFNKLKSGVIRGESFNNVSTHSYLVIELKNESCAAWVDFNSIRDLGKHIFPLKTGTIKIDKTLFKKGIVKAIFDFQFKNTLKPKEKLFWKGKIYSKIKQAI